VQRYETQKSIALLLNQFVLKYWFFSIFVFTFKADLAMNLSQQESQCHNFIIFSFNNF